MSDSSPVLRLQPGQTALVGYGSLLSRASLDETLGRAYTGPFLQCSIRGWRRTWNAAWPNDNIYTELPGIGRMVPQSILYLNVRRDPASTVNGTVFVVNAEELVEYDRGELIYDRADVTSDLDVRVQGGAAHMYVCRPEFCLTSVQSPATAAVRASYLRIIENALAQVDEDFRARYRSSTDPVPAHLVIDDRAQ